MYRLLLKIQDRRALFRIYKAAFHPLTTCMTVKTDGFAGADVSVVSKKRQIQHRFQKGDIQYSIPEKGYLKSLVLEDKA